MVVELPVVRLPIRELELQLASVNLTPLDIFKEVWGCFQTRYFKLKHYVFLTLTQ